MKIKIEVCRDDGTVLMSNWIHTHSSFMWQAAPGQELRDGEQTLALLNVHPCVGHAAQMTVRCVCGQDIAFDQLPEHFGVDSKDHLVETADKWLPRTLGAP